MMKKILVAVFFMASSAQASTVLSGEEMQELTKTICSEHSEPDLCIKGFNKVMGYVKANDDYHYFCENSKKTFMTVDDEQCKKSEELRDFIDKNEN